MLPILCLGKKKHEFLVGCFLGIPWICLMIWGWGSGELLGGGFKYFLFSPLFGEDSHFD